MIERSHDYGIDVTFDTYPYFFFQAEDGIRDFRGTGVQTCALPISETVEQRHEHDRREESDSKRGCDAEDPRDEPPPMGGGEQPQQPTADDEGRDEPESEGLRDVLEPTAQVLAGQPESALPSESADVGEGEFRRGEGAEEDGEESPRGRPARPSESEDGIPRGRRAPCHQGRREKTN